jgi:hypothetical protein
MKAIAILIATIILSGCAMVKENETCTGYWPDSILNPENGEFVTEVAFNLGIENSEVTQEQFNERYINNQ